MRKTIPILFALFATAFLLGATTATTSSQKKKKAAPKTAAKTAGSPKTNRKPISKTASKTVSKTPGKTATKTSAYKAGSRKTTTASRRGMASKPAVQSWRNTQRTPTPDRYKEIQEALASKGYMDSNSTSGVWDSSSVSALKKFQQDQSLEPSGKLDSLSIIALGLGPKHEQQTSPSPEPRQ